MRVLAGRQWLFSFAFSKTKLVRHIPTGPRLQVSSSLPSLCTGISLRRRQYVQATSSRLKMELIDVDCNLWHKDLKSLQGKDVSNDEYWNILHEDAIEQAKRVLSLDMPRLYDVIYNLQHDRFIVDRIPQ